MCLGLSHCQTVLRWWWLLFVLGWSCSVPRCSAKYQYGISQHQQLQNEKKHDKRHNESGVCDTVRINSLEKLNGLKNCKIVEGSIEIFRIKFVSKENEQEWSFPDLVEITDFLLVYHVEGLTSLGQLFPNLTVIRGMKLLERYSLVIYNTHIEVIGLYNLRAILRGSVKIKNNINLCYVHTVNWAAIVQGPDDNVLMDNSESLCRKCCPTCSVGWKLESRCLHCWNSTKCQQIMVKAIEDLGSHKNRSICSSNCSHGCTGKADDQCCHEQCLGGCTMPDDPSACRACRNFNFQGTCIEACPKYFLEYKEYRCVDSHYCKEKKFYQFNKRRCVSDCPEGYQKGNNSKCVKCKYVCPKECHGRLVNTVARAQELKDCTVINGSLIISIRYGKTVTKELEANLGKIERVFHHVRIFKTSPLKSLNFLSNLRTIDGLQLYSNMFALYVHDNANLEEIWDFNNRSELNIKKGKISFLENPKLCYHTKIEKLLNMTGQAGDHNMKVTNGYKVACSIMKHGITLEPQPFMVVVKWTPVSTIEDDRKITGYFIYYKETNETNVGHMDGRDACNDEWKREHAEVKDSDSMMTVTLTGLKPNHRYAVYVETDTVADADIGARSNITYTITKPYNPSYPLNLRVIDKGTTYIAVAWSPPSSPNGEIYDYIISLTTLVDTEVKCQDYCKTEQLHHDEIAESEKGISESEVSKIGSTLTTSTPSPKCCACPAKPTPTVEDDEINFENILHNHIYVHRTSRKKRSTEPGDGPSEETSTNLWEAQYTDYQNENHTAEIDVWRSRTNSFNFTQLSHYTEYMIEVSACHEPQYECPGNKVPCELCSTMPAKIVETTAVKVNANMVTDLNAKQINQSIVEVTWEPPVSPNGQVLAYKVSFTSAQEDVKVCVSSCKFNESQMKYYLDVQRLTPNTKYLVEVQVYTRAPKNVNDTAATAEFTTQYFAEMQNRDHGWMLLLLVIFLLLGMACGVLIFRKLRPPKLAIKDVSENPCYPHDPSPASSSIPSKYQVDPNNLRLEESSLLGQGNFGTVFKGHLQQGFEWVPVAVKQTSNLPSKEDMLLEAKLMLELESCHIVHAYGVMFGPNHTYLVMEYMSKGDLLKYLRKQETRLKIEQVCDMALQIADGMAYLASKNYVHRDLAARNCLINDDMKIKISDFGMTRITEENYYHIRHSKPFPVRWLAPECFTKQRFTSQSDVWSYGIVLWEILTLGRTPYQDLSTNDRVREMVSNGHTLKSNVRSLTDKWLAELICWCWEAEGHDRPSFPKIISILLPHASPLFIQLFRLVSFYHQSNCQE
uniref:receptor protein-tyrosine kinase n=1 Tax=Gecarcinus lateralis TaxID=6769 RepID=A0AAU0MVQ7_GECLA